MSFLSSSPGIVEELEEKRDSSVGEVAEFISYLKTVRNEAQEILGEVDEARTRLDRIEDDAKSVKQFVDQLPSFNGGDN